MDDKLSKFPALGISWVRNFSTCWFIEDNQSTETVRSADEQIEEAEQEIRDSFFDMAVLTICRYLAFQMVPTDWEHVPVTELTGCLQKLRSAGRWYREIYRRGWRKPSPKNKKGAA